MNRYLIILHLFFPCLSCLAMDYGRLLDIDDKKVSYNEQIFAGLVQSFEISYPIVTGKRKGCRLFDSREGEIGKFNLILKPVNLGSFMAKAKLHKKSAIKKYFWDKKLFFTLEDKQGIGATHQSTRYFARQTEIHNAYSNLIFKVVTVNQTTLYAVCTEPEFFRP